MKQLVMVLDKEKIEALIAAAKVNPRLRQNLDLRNSPEDNSQRMLNALEPGTELPIHRHTKSSETTAVLRGSIRQNFYELVEDDSNNGKPHLKLSESVIISANGPCPIYVVPQGMWHNTECLESGTILFEAKDGRYEPLAEKDILKK